MVECVLSPLKRSEILSCGKASAFSTAKNVELLGLYPRLRDETMLHGVKRSMFNDQSKPSKIK